MSNLELTKVGCEKSGVNRVVENAILESLFWNSALLLDFEKITEPVNCAIPPKLGKLCVGHWSCWFTWHAHFTENQNGCNSKHCTKKLSAVNCWNEHVMWSLQNGKFSSLGEWFTPIPPWISSLYATLYYAVTMLFFWRSLPFIVTY